MNLEFRKLKSSDNLDRVCELIYNVDPYCYRDLFGNLNNAKKVLKFLFNEQNSTFYKNNYYVAVYNNEIVGIISFFLHFVEWDNSIIECAFGSCNLKIPASFYTVTKYFKESYNYFSYGASTCQVSVYKELQNQKIGSFLMENILNIYGKSDIQLNVAKDNVKAIHLYEKYGFVKIDEHDDYAGENMPYIKSYKMYRSGR